jgi:hypothetical protein
MRLKQDLPVFFMGYFCIFFLVLITASKFNSDQVTLKIQNSCGYPIEVYFVNDISRLDDNQLVPQTKSPLRNGTTTKILSYFGHYFIVKPSKALFVNRESKIENIFQKLSRTESVEVKSYDNNTGIFQISQRTFYDEVKSSIDRAKVKCRFNISKREDIKECLAKEVSNLSADLTETRELIRKYNSNMARQLYKYTCNDSSIATKSFNHKFPISVYDKLYKRPLHYTANVALDKESAKIWSINNFISREECSALISYAKDNLFGNS